LQKTELTQQAEPHEAAEQGQGRGLGGAGLAAAFEGSPGVNFINSILAEKLNYVGAYVQNISSQHCIKTKIY
jgi:hypothetical protein